MAFMVSPVRPRVALDGEAAFGVSADGIVYLLLLMVFVSVIANFIEQFYQKRMANEFPTNETFVKPSNRF
jgi:hypothetical protein